MCLRAAQGRGMLIYLREGTVGVPPGRHEECSAAEARRERHAGAWPPMARRRVGAQNLRDPGITRTALPATGRRR